MTVEKIKENVREIKRNKLRERVANQIEKARKKQFSLARQADAETTELNNNVMEAKVDDYFRKMA